ncbi:hypothetical protein V2J09_002253 [Rumex salicifolius]
MIEDPLVLDVVRQLDQACREAGFFYVKGHGISDSLIKDVREITHQFFHLPHEEKLKIKLSSATGYRGYQEVGDNITKGVPDQHEAIDLSLVGKVVNRALVHMAAMPLREATLHFYKEMAPGRYGDIGKPMEGSNLWPSYPPTFKSLMEEYVNLCTDLSRKIMQGIAIAIGGSSHQFEGGIAGEPFWVMRLIGYPANGYDKLENDVGCGAHTDYGLLTLVNQDENITALQVRNHSGEWIWAPPVPGTFVCNIGDMLKILTNGMYESTQHRVINNAPKYRVCVAYFYETNYDAVIEPLKVCVNKTGGVKKLGKAVYGEHLISKVTTNFRY